MPHEPAYLRLAARLREQIMSGSFGPGDRLPSETGLMEAYGVSRSVAKWAISVLKGEGLVEGRQGAGVYVRRVRRLTREAHGRDLRQHAGGVTSPFAGDTLRAGRRARWEHRSVRGTAGPDIACRLAVQPGDPVMCTTYRFFADAEPVQLSTSWEPLALTDGTPVCLPEEGAAVGVVARMDRIGVRVDEFVERVTVRPASGREIEALNLPTRGAFVLVIIRTYLAAGKPVETADIVISSERYELVYRVPVD